MSCSPVRHRRHRLHSISFRFCQGWRSHCRNFSDAVKCKSTHSAFTTSEVLLNMESAKSLCKKLLNFKNTVITGCEFYTDADSVNHIRIQARPSKWHENECPYCHRRCPGYDSRCRKPRIWRGLDWGTTLVEIEYQTHRIECPEHGVVVADIPWAYPGSGFTKDFDLTAAHRRTACKH